jgi:citrate lyase subunit beta / citryl-CoA lyase
MQPRRSVLYMPASNARALEKAKTLAADSLIFDLEDAVAPSEKLLARQQLVDILPNGGYGHREIIVRINALDTEWGRDDLMQIANLPIHALLVPKISYPQQVLEVVETLEEVDNYTLPIWIMAETPQAILQINAIAASHPRLKVIIMGTSDLAKDLRVRHTADRLGLLTALNLCVLAARANGLEIIDGVHLNLQDEAEFTHVCIQGRDLGFDGKTLIHPKQIEIANRIFSPSEAEITQAQQIINAWQQSNKGVVVVNGKLIENLHVDEAKRTLALAAAIQQRSE